MITRFFLPHHGVLKSGNRARPLRVVFNGSFVGNRVSKLQNLIENFFWHYISSENNTADLLSRGLNATDLVNCHLWWKGFNLSQTDDAAISEQCH
ncbi:hypothetical protein NPIL_685611 [Nephila pilipes]|uniref:Uncharacterized protein n=1 Tax=Nephila pilipes TaxID=299642 RepID=A0A8X6TW53_NEPPI|nr:hypothetical protein NPIL_685611 [Nephila pilipes]